MHDAFYLSESKEKEARKIMQETAEKWFGVKGAFMQLTDCYLAYLRISFVFQAIITQK